MLLAPASIVLVSCSQPLTHLGEGIVTCNMQSCSSMHLVEGISNQIATFLHYHCHVQMQKLFIIVKHHTNEMLGSGILIIM